MPHLNLLLVLSVVLAIGCAPASDPIAENETPGSDTTPVAPADPPSESATTATVAPPTFASLEEVSQHIKALGRPAVVDYWSLACQPCMDEFPGLVRLHEQRGDRVSCIAVDVDFDGRKSKPPETYQEPVTAFLTQQQASFRSFICTTPSDDVYANLEIDSIPTVFVYAADGSVAKKFVDAGDTAGFTYAKDVAPFVEQMLADTNP